MVGGIICYIFAILMLVSGIVLQIIDQRQSWSILCLGFLFIIPGYLSIENYRNPVATEEDVFSGKAEYIETMHITEGDTIRTYKIEWKK